jgi:cytidylate kinase
MSSAPAPPHVVAIDGPSGSGKSTVARAVATRLGLRYLDTGALYRALTWLALQQGTDLDDPAAVTAALAGARLKVGTDPERPTVAVDGTDVTVAIRGREVTNAVSAVSAVPGVRAQLLGLQRDIIGTGRIVVEGRDIGTTVAPGASVKVFLTASGEARARRRQIEEADRGDAASVHRTRVEIERRDARDSARTASPLTRAPDATEVDSTERSIDAVVEAVLALCAAAGLGAVLDAGRAST